MPSDSTIIGAATIWNYKFIDGSQIGGGTGLTAAYLTSTPYPIYEAETLEVAPGVRSFQAYSIEIPLLEVAPAITEANLRAIVTLHDQPPELPLDVEPSITSAVLNQIVTSHSQPPELPLDIEPAITDALLEVIVVAHSQPADAPLDVAPAVTFVSLGA